MKLVTWVKSLSWVAILGVVVTAASMVLNARRAGKMEAEAAHGEAKIEKLTLETHADIKAAKDLQRSIDVKKDEARAIRKKSEKSLERIGQDETMADIAKRFNGKRVRHRSDPAT